jgi:hypothetical protein
LTEFTLPIGRPIKVFPDNTAFGENFRQFTEVFLRNIRGYSGDYQCDRLDDGFKILLAPGVGRPLKEEHQRRSLAIRLPDGTVQVEMAGTGDDRSGI